MDLKDLKLNRFGLKDANQSDDTKDAVYASMNPSPKQLEQWRKIGQGNKSNQEDRGAPNIITGTVITSCFIQTSALPSRVEIAGNDITFYDDTYEKNGEVKGDTSRIVWTHDLSSNQGFIMEKRASIFDTYDNVFSFYALEPREGKMNYMFFGREGNTQHFDTHYILFNVNHSSGPVTQAIANGSFIITGSTDGVFSNVTLFGVYHNSLVGVPGEGYSVYLSGRGTGVIALNSDIVPSAAGIDLGEPGSKFGTFYGSVSACPLPTVENALDLLKAIPAPTLVGERGHYGLERKYFDDLTFPAELLYTDHKGRVDIEHNHMLGFLLKVVIEQQAQIDSLLAKQD